MIEHEGIYNGKLVKWGSIEERTAGTDFWNKVYFEVTSDSVTIAPHLMKGQETMMCDEMPPHPHVLSRETLEKILKEMDACDTRRD